MSMRVIKKVLVSLWPNYIFFIIIIIFFFLGGGGGWAGAWPSGWVSDLQ